MVLFDWFRKSEPSSPNSPLVDDARKAAQRIAGALQSSGYAADFSLQSLKEIDRFFDEQVRNGEPAPGGLLAQQLGTRIFALGSYVGECIVRHHRGEWKADDGDPEGEINIQVVLPNGTVIRPVQRVMKRYRNGAEDGIYVYGQLAGSPSS